MDSDENIQRRYDQTPKQWNTKLIFPELFLTIFLHVVLSSSHVLCPGEN